jgi:regulator of protease activity HflC (stomatin/prohibitin superfamily)
MSDQTIDVVKNPRTPTGGGAPYANGPAAVLLALLICAAIGGPLAWIGTRGSPPRGEHLAIALVSMGVGIAAAFLLASTIRVVSQWERAVVLRNGRFIGLRGPGLFLVAPVVDSVTKVVDQRIRSTDFAAETCLTRDTVPVNVDAIAFWVVWDAQKCVLEVEDFFQAVVLSAQTALRDAIGTHELAALVSDRKDIGKELQAILDAKTHDWGVTIQSVEIRDVRLPKDLEDGMSRKAQAERERQARIILGTAETEIAQKFVEAADRYASSPTAMQLRAMNMLYEGMKEKTSLVVVPSPMAGALDVTSAAGGVGGLAALAARAHEAAGSAGGRLGAGGAGASAASGNGAAEAAG